MTRLPECSCGGRLRKANLDKVELAPFFGLRGVLEGPIPGLRCGSCKLETLSGRSIDRMLIAVALSVMSQRRILTTEEARFLRKAVLGMTQTALAKHMGINPTTVADWERGERTLSKEHDYELRGVALSSLVARFSAQFEGLVRDLPRILKAPRTLAPPKRTKRYVVRASEMPAA